MKKLFTFFILIISFQASSSEEIRYFSPQEISAIIESSLPVNPLIKNKDLVYQGNVFGYIIDYIRVPMIIKKGDNLTSILERGIPEYYIRYCKSIKSSSLISERVDDPINKNENKTKINTITLLLVMSIVVIALLFLFILFLFLKDKRKKE